MNAFTKTARKNASRRGSIYIATLGVATMVTVIGLTTFHLSRLELEAVNAQQDAQYARLLAQSGVEFGLGRICLDPDWRTNYTHDVEFTGYPTGVSEDFTCKFVDPADGDLADDATEPVEIVGIGRYGEATHVYTVTYEGQVSADGQVGPIVLANYDVGGGAHATGNISSNLWLGQYFVPSLPPEAVSWSVQSVDVMARQNGNADLHLCIATESGGLPGTLIESQIVDTFQLPTSYDWVTVPFTSVSGLAPGQGLCLTVEGVHSMQYVDVQYENGGVVQSNSHMIEAISGTWTNAYTDKAIWYRVRCMYTTSNGTSTEFRITPGSWRREMAP